MNLDSDYSQNWCDRDRDVPSSLELDANKSIQIQKPLVNDCYYSDERMSLQSLPALYQLKAPTPPLPEVNDEEEEIDFEGWLIKGIESWSVMDTKNWLFSASQKLGQLYRQISPKLVLPGKSLLLLSRKDFLVYDQRFGGKLYDLLHGCEANNSLQFHDDQHHFQKVPEFKLELESDGGSTPEQSCSSSDEEPEDCSKSVKRKRGRPRNTETKSKEVGPKVWEFIRNLLRDPRYCPELIRWENYEEKTFRFVDTQKVAEFWGARNNNENMNFGKFSRAMRYYYDKDILVSVPRRRLVYKFGPLATGLEKIECPNFDADYFKKS